MSEEKQSAALQKREAFLSACKSLLNTDAGQAIQNTINYIQLETSFQINKLNNFTCDEPAKVENAISLSASIKAFVDKLEKGRHAIVNPLYQYTKQVNAQFAQLTEKMMGQKSRIDREVMDVRRAEEKRIAEENARRAEEEQKARQAQIEAAEKGEDVGTELATVDREAEQATITEQSAAFTDAKAHTRKDWKYEVLDLDKVPMEFCKKTTVHKLIAAHLAKHGDSKPIPGIRAWQEEKLVTSKKN